MSQVFANMQRAQEQHLFTVTDWSVANAKLEEVHWPCDIHVTPVYNTLQQNKLYKPNTSEQLLLIVLHCKGCSICYHNNLCMHPIYHWSEEHCSLRAALPCLPGHIVILSKQTAAWTWMFLETAACVDMWAVSVVLSSLCFAGFHQVCTKHWSWRRQLTYVWLSLSGFVKAYLAYQVEGVVADLFEHVFCLKHKKHEAVRFLSVLLRDVIMAVNRLIMLEAGLLPYGSLECHWQFVQ